jgi:hypothetical protein
VRPNLSNTGPELPVGRCRTDWHLRFLPSAQRLPGDLTAFSPGGKANEQRFPQDCGGMGIRTPGLVIANDALYQLSYTPDNCGDIVAARWPFSTAQNPEIPEFTARFNFANCCCSYAESSSPKTSPDFVPRLQVARSVDEICSHLDTFQVNPRLVIHLAFRTHSADQQYLLRFDALFG